MFNNVTITNVTEVFNVFLPKDSFRTINNRTCYGLSFCEEGQITYMHNGTQVTSDRNHAVILPQNQSYSLRGIQTGMFPVINFTCTAELCDTIISIPIETPDAYISDIKKIQSLVLFCESRMEILSVFYHMLHRMSSQNKYCKIIQPAVKYIEKNYANPRLTNSELAMQCNISEIYFRRMFTKQYNMTPKQFILDVRINHAKQLLTEGILKINAIAEKCGFSNQYHFDHIFKDKTGLTPTEYMKLNNLWYANEIGASPNAK